MIFFFFLMSLFLWTCPKECLTLCKDGHLRGREEPPCIVGVFPLDTSGCGRYPGRAGTALPLSVFIEALVQVFYLCRAPCTQGWPFYHNQCISFCLLKNHKCFQKALFGSVEVYQVPFLHISRDWCKEHAQVGRLKLLTASSHQCKLVWIMHL